MGEVADPVRVVIADDERLMRAGLRLLIDGNHGIEVVAEAEDGEQVVALAAEHDPDVVLMDVRMPRCDGIAATERLREARCRTVMLTAFDDDAFLVGALRAGAVSFLLKAAPPEEVVAAVLDAAEGKARFSAPALDRLARLAAGQTVPTIPVPEGVTDREWDVAMLVARGLTNAEICDRLHLALPTVKTHIGRLFDKLQVTNRVQLAIRVLEIGDQ